VVHQDVVAARLCGGRFLVSFVVSLTHVQGRSRGTIKGPLPGCGTARTGPGHEGADLESVLATGLRRPINTVELSSCQGQTDLRCSSKVQQPARLTSELHRPDTTLWPAPATFIDLLAASYGSEGWLASGMQTASCGHGLSSAGGDEINPRRG
jgi:hypothetical protein